MLTLPVQETSGFKHITQLSSCKTKYVAFNVSPLRAACGCERLCQSPFRRAKHNAVLPINQIPIELLCEIFFKVLEDDREFPDCTPVARPLVSFRSRADPTILSQVCSWWRSVSLSAPELWAKIAILETGKSKYYRTCLWLARAGTHPLDLSIREVRKEGEFEVQPLHDILSLFISRLQFWRKIEFSLPIAALELLASITVKSNAHLILQSASIHIISPSRTERPQSSIDAMWKVFHSSSVLQQLNWWGAYPVEMPSHAPWSQLTNITLELEFSPETLINVLSLCPQIQEVDVFRLSSTISSEQFKQREPLILERLHTFLLDTEVDAGPLFRSLTLPSLRSLSLHQDLDDFFVRDFGALHTCLMRSKCCLQMFSLSDYSLREDDIIECLASPSLRNVLFLEVSALISDKVIECLTRRNVLGCPEVMPFLKELRLLPVYTKHDGLLAQMVSSRWSTDSNSQKKLKKLMLRSDGEYGAQDDQALSMMFNSGLQGWKY